MSSRQIHLWSGVLLALPMFIVGVTAILIAHEKSLGIKDVPINWLFMAAEKELELRSVAQAADGRLWLAAQGDVAKPYTIGKLVMDMHTGKAFFGKSGEWVWIDVLGFTLALLGLTGVWVWWQSRRRAAI